MGVPTTRLPPNSFLPVLGRVCGIQVPRRDNAQQTSKRVSVAKSTYVENRCVRAEKSVKLDIVSITPALWRVMAALSVLPMSILTAKIDNRSIHIVDSALVSGYTGCAISVAPTKYNSSLWRSRFLCMLFELGIGLENAPNERGHVYHASNLKSTPSELIAYAELEQVVSEAWSDVRRNSDALFAHRLFLTADRFLLFARQGGLFGANDGDDPLRVMHVTLRKLFADGSESGDPLAAVCYEAAKRVVVAVWKAYGPRHHAMRMGSFFPSSASFPRTVGMERGILGVIDDDSARQGIYDAASSHHMKAWRWKDDSSSQSGMRRVYTTSSQHGKLSDIVCSSNAHAPGVWTSTMFFDRRGWKNFNPRRGVYVRGGLAV